MNAWECCFWVCGAVVLYTYFLYPILLVAFNTLLRRQRIVEPFQTSVSILLPVHNEEANLERRLDELTRLIAASGMPGEVLVISDGSTDRSVEIARRFADRGVRVLETPHKGGKAAALNLGFDAARNDVLIFADARQRWADDALLRLVENFADPQVGAVSGDLVLESPTGALVGVGLYWRFEKWLRQQESRFGSQVGVTGAISAVRRTLFHKIPPGTLLDDVYWPLCVALQKYRVVHDGRARAYDRLPEKSRDEFRRKVRTLAGNYQLLTLLPTAALFPWSNPVWWQWVSRKLLRLVVPWALVGMLLSSTFLEESPYPFLMWVQLACYGLGVLGLIPSLGRAIKLLGTAASFLVLNTAAWLAFWVWISGRAGASWHKVQYTGNSGGESA